MVRSHLDYYFSVWSPYMKKDIEALEKVQKRATNILPRLKHMNCDLLGEKVPKVGWQTTELHSSKQNTGSLMKKLILLFSATPLWVPFLPAGHISISVNSSKLNQFFSA